MRQKCSEIFTELTRIDSNDYNVRIRFNKRKRNKYLYTSKNPSLHNVRIRLNEIIRLNLYAWWYTCSVLEKVPFEQAGFYGVFVRGSGKASLGVGSLRDSTERWWCREWILRNEVGLSGENDSACFWVALLFDELIDPRCQRGNCGMRSGQND